MIVMQRTSLFCPLILAPAATPLAGASFLPTRGLGNEEWGNVTPGTDLSPKMSLRQQNIEGRSACQSPKNGLANFG